ncbi:MAG: purine-binding chemotaxis protein CheW [Gemmatimonadetes bacterium]|nr:purine-binding chemotaxis protein CheW [Gemmatimonadota bacterium]
MAESSDEVQLVVFRLGDAEFGFNIFQVERVLRHQAPEPLPNAPPFLKGLLPYGDGVVPVIDLRTRVGAPAPLSDETRIIIVELEQGRVGVVVSAVREVLRVAAERVTPPPALVRGLAAGYISGIVRLEQRTVIVLAASKLLTSTERIALDELLVGTKR